MLLLFYKLTGQKMSSNDRKSDKMFVITCCLVKKKKKKNDRQKKVSDGQVWSISCFCVTENKEGEWYFMKGCNFTLKKS